MRVNLRNLRAISSPKAFWVVSSKCFAQPVIEEGRRQEAEGNERSVTTYTESALITSLSPLSPLSSMSSRVPVLENKGVIATDLVLPRIPECW